MRRRRTHLELKTADQVRAMRRAGVVVADALKAMTDACAPGVSTADLDDIARQVLAEAGATSNFLGYDIGYGPFPAVICASLNDRVVHGIPSRTEVMADGDLISIDFGAIVDGWHGDAAVTVAVGPVDEVSAGLSEACRTALWDGIAAARAGHRLGDLSASIEASVQRAGEWGIVEGFGGHGIGTAMHMDPHILNYGHAGTGIKLVGGMVLAIEPMLTAGRPDTQQLPDGWTIRTADGSRAAHWEHTVALLEDGPWVLTAPDGGRTELDARGVGLAALAA
ncbi:MAG: type I methionyl aminopeptidase [bacterium]